MNKEQLKNEIKNSLEQLQQEYQSLLNNKGEIPAIETDMLLERIRRLYEQVLLLGKDAGALAESEIKRQTQDVINRATEKEKAIDYAAKPAKKITEETLMKEVFKQEEVVAGIKEEVKAPVPVIEKTEQLEAVIAGTVKAKPEKKSAQSVGDRFEEQPTLLDKISSGQIDSTIAGKLQKKPLDDLKKSIGVNERFFLTNDLFNGNANRYNECMEQLNKAATHEEAITLLNTGFVQQNNWDTKSKAFIMLQQFVERRFLKQ